MSDPSLAKFPKKEPNIKNVTPLDKSTWTALVAKYQTPSPWRSINQVTNSFIPFFLLWAAMAISLNYSYWLTLALVLPTAGFLVRIFIIQHDCGHGSFFRSRKANDYLGSICGVLTLTPYYYWRKSHAIHHATASNLAERGIGDIYTMTVKEYLGQSRWGRLRYRLYRHPLFLFVIAPTILFLVLYRFPHPDSKSWKKERASVWWTNVALVATVVLVSLIIGFKAFLLVQLPISVVAATLGTFMFVVYVVLADYIVI